MTDAPFAGVRFHNEAKDDGGGASSPVRSPREDLVPRLRQKAQDSPRSSAGSGKKGVSPRGRIESPRASRDSRGETGGIFGAVGGLISFGGGSKSPRKSGKGSKLARSANSAMYDMSIKDGSYEVSLAGTHLLRLKKDTPVLGFEVLVRHQDDEPVKFICTLKDIHVFKKALERQKVNLPEVKSSADVVPFFTEVFQTDLRGSPQLVDLIASGADAMSSKNAAPSSNAADAFVDEVLQGFGVPVGSMLATVVKKRPDVAALIREGDKAAPSSGALGSSGSNRSGGLILIKKKDAATKAATHVFGVSLDEVVARDGAPPPFLFALITHLLTFGTQEEGIFRISGSMDTLNMWKERIDSNPQITFTPDSIFLHDAAGLVKMYFRDLPQPLFPFSAFKEVIAVDLDAPDTECDSQILRILEGLPSHSRQLLTAFVHLLALIAGHSVINKMDAANLSRSIANGLLRAEVEDIASIVSNSHKVNAVFQRIIERHHLYFEKPRAPPRPPKGAPKTSSSVALPKISSGSTVPTPSSSPPTREAPVLTPQAASASVQSSPPPADWKTVLMEKVTEALMEAREESQRTAQKVLDQVLAASTTPEELEQLKQEPKFQEIVKSFSTTSPDQMAAATGQLMRMLAELIHSTKQKKEAQLNAAKEFLASSPQPISRGGGVAAPPRSSAGGVKAGAGTGIGAIRGSGASSPQGEGHLPLTSSQFDYVDCVADASLVCSLCGFPAVDPSAAACSHLFCAHCIRTKQHEHCKLDGIAFRSSLSPPSPALVEALGSLAVHCIAHGLCAWQGPRSKLRGHLASDCQFKVYICSSCLQPAVEGHHDAKLCQRDFVKTFQETFRETAAKSTKHTPLLQLFLEADDDDDLVDDPDAQVNVEEFEEMEVVDVGDSVSSPKRRPSPPASPPPLPEVELSYREARDEDLPPLPLDPPPLSDKASYKAYMILRYEYQRRGLVSGGGATLNETSPRRSVGFGSVSVTKAAASLHELGASPQLGRRNSSSIVNKGDSSGTIPLLGGVSKGEKTPPEGSPRGGAPSNESSPRRKGPVAPIPGTVVGTPPPRRPLPPNPK